MDLAKLGQIAGVAGIAIGAVVLLFRSLIERGLTGMPPKDRGRAVITIALCAFGIGLAGISAWAFAGTQGGTSVTTYGHGSGVALGGRDARIGASSLPAPTPDVGTLQTEAPCASPSPLPGVHIETRGDRAPVAVGGCDATTTIPAPPAAPPQR